MKTSNAGVLLIKSFESFRSKPYLDGGGVPTIGYGSTRLADGSRVTLKTPAITEAEALKILLLYVDRIQAHISSVVKVPLSQGQFDALVSLVYNIGEPEFDDSTMLKLINRLNYHAAALEFPKWNHDNGKVVDGLTRRRLAEQSMFLGAQK